MKFEGPKSVKIKKCPKVGYFGLVSYPKSVTTIGCQLGSKGGYNTGLTEDEERYYEKALDLQPNQLNKHSKWWGDVFNVEYAIRLNNTKTTELIMDNPVNQLKYKVLLAHTDVANSELEKSKPGVQFFIDDEELKAKEELKTLNFELEGMKLIIGFTPDEKKGALRLFGKIGLDTMSEDVASSYLMQEMKRDPKKFFDIVTDKEMKTKMFISELSERKILTRTGNMFKYGDDIIANSTPECVEYLNDPKNQSVRLALETKLKKHKKA